MKIGFTVGIWDLFHEGHINFLKKAKEKCDYLVVGIMNDYWTRVQKGHERPIDSLEKRYINLKNCNFYDKIIILDTLDMSQYLQICDIWFRGEQQKNMRPFECKNIEWIERTPNISTTEIFEKMKKEDF